jgi:hypothetical protein
LIIEEPKLPRERGLQTRSTFQGGLCARLKWSMISEGIERFYLTHK